MDDLTSSSLQKPNTIQIRSELSDSLQLRHYSSEIDEKIVIESPSEFSFSRDRRVSVNWQTLFRETDIESEIFQLESIRRLLETSWGARPYSGVDLRKYLLKGEIGFEWTFPTSEGSDYIPDLFPDLQPRTAPFKPNLEDQTLIVIPSVDPNVDGTYYWIVPKKGMQLAFNDDYDHTWNHRIEVIIKVKPQEIDFNSALGGSRSLAASIHTREDHSQDESYTSSYQAGFTSLLPDEYYRNQLTERVDRIFDSIIGKYLSPQDVAAKATTNTSHTPSIFRQIAEEGWGVDVNNIYRPISDFSDYVMSYSEFKSNSHYKDIRLFSKGSTTKKVKFGFLGLRSIWITVPEMVEIQDSAIVFVDANSQRKYTVELMPESGEVNLNNKLGYEKAWERQFSNLILATEVKTDIETPDNEQLADTTMQIFGRGETVLISELYRKHESRREVLEILLNAYKKTFENSDADQLAGESLNISRYEHFHQEHSLTIQLLHQLKARADALGYELFIHDDEAVKDNPPFFQPFINEANAPPSVREFKLDNPRPGVLYIKRLQTAQWVEVHTRQEPRTVRTGSRSCGFLGLGRCSVYQTLMVNVDYAKPRSSEYIEYIEVDAEHEPWRQQRDEFRKNGFTIHMLTQSEKGYVTDTGQSLGSIMARCHYDEPYRLKCVLFVPVTEESLTYSNVVTKYLVVRRPLPGIRPIALPQVAIRERLIYSNAIMATSVGKIIKSINLAPGEEKTISFNRSYTLKRDIRRSINSVLDIENENSTDFSSAMESEFRSETDNKSSNSDSSELNATRGGISAGMNTSSSSSNSLSQYANDISKLARKAAGRMRKSTKEAVEFTESESFTSTSSESTTSKIRNINDGATLNLFFHELYHECSGTLILEGFDLSITHPVELVMGTGIRETKVFNSNQLHDLIDWLDMSMGDYSSNNDEDKSVLAVVIRQILEVINKDYIQELGLKINIDKHKDILNSLLKNEDGHEISEVEKSIADLQATWLSIESNGIQINKTHYSIPAKAYYLDAQIGAGAATEPYAEAARFIELDRQRRENDLKSAYTERVLSEARVRYQDGLDNLLVVASPKIIHWKLNQSYLVIETSSKLPEMTWEALIDDQTYKLTSISTTKHSVSWSNLDQPHEVELVCWSRGLRITSSNSV